MDQCRRPEVPLPPELAGSRREHPFELFDASDRYVVQEWIEGGDADVHFCLVYRDRAGREVAYQTGRKLVQWPVGTGDTALGTTTEDPTLHRLTEQVFDRAGMSVWVRWR